MDSLSSRIRSMLITILQTRAGAICTLTVVPLVRAGLSPHSEILDGDVCAGRAIRTLHFDGAALGAVCFGSFPVSDCDVGELDTVAGYLAHAAPGAVDVEGVGVAVAWLVSGCAREIDGEWCGAYR